MKDSSNYTQQCCSFNKGSRLQEIDPSLHCEKYSSVMVQNSSVTPDRLIALLVGKQFGFCLAALTHLSYSVFDVFDMRHVASDTGDTRRWYELLKLLNWNTNSEDWLESNFKLFLNVAWIWLTKFLIYGFFFCPEFLKLIKTQTGYVNHDSPKWENCVLIRYWLIGTAPNNQKKIF